MKALLFIIFLLNIKISNAQDINGIGVIKLGKTEAQIISDLKIESKNIIDGASETMKVLGKKASKKYIKIRFDPTSKLIKDMLSSSSNLDYRLKAWGIEKCSDAEVLLIPKFEVAGVTIEYLKLMFYKDTLIRISYENSNDNNKNFLLAFKAKHGEGKSSYYSNDKKTYFSTTFSWESTVPNVIAESEEINSYTDETDWVDVAFGGGSSHTYSFKIENSQYVRYLNDCNKKGASNKKNDEL